MIKLGALLIDDKAINAEPYDPADIPEGKTLYTFGDPLPGDYMDISSIESWNAHRDKVDRDNIWVNDRLREFGDVNDDTYNAYTDEEKQVLAENNATTKARVIAVLGGDADSIIADFERDASEKRRHRFSHMIAVIKNNCTEVSQHVILDSLNGSLGNWIDFGVQGIGFGDTVDGIMNWVESSEGYVGTGMMDLTITFETSMTKTELRDELIKIGYDGDYDYGHHY